MILAEMTSPEIDALPRDIVVLMPVASCEQHSLHLPVFTDSLIGGEVARRVHERCPDDVLVLPVQWLGYSQHHIRYPGTVSAVSDTHLLLMMDIVASMVGHGFRKILIQNSHGGNGANVSVLLQRLMERYPDGDVEFYSRWAWASGEKLDRIRQLGSGGSGHAGETETSMILAIRPELVRTDRLHAGRRAGGHARAGRGFLPPVRSAHETRRRWRSHGRECRERRADAGRFRRRGGRTRQADSGPEAVRLAVH